MRTALALAIALTLPGCAINPSHVIGLGYMAAQVAPREPNRFECKPPRVERNGICGNPEAFGGKK